MRRIIPLCFFLAACNFATQLQAQDLSQPYVENQVLVRFAPGAAAADRALIRGALLPQGGRALGLVPGLERIVTALDVPQAIAVLANNPNVLYVEPDYIVQPIDHSASPSDDYFYLQWGLHNYQQDIQGSIGTDGSDIQMQEAWDVEAPLLAANNISPTIVAVIDTGTQLNHDDLAANIWINSDETPGDIVDDDENGFINDMHGWDFFSGDNDPSDEHGHGTHTAGTIAAVRNNDPDPANDPDPGKDPSDPYDLSGGVAGVCGNCKIMVLRFLGPNGGSTSDAIAALQYAVANGATVSNNSWGGGAFSQGLYDAIKAAGDQGHIFVAASGNNGTDTDVFPHYPSSYNVNPLKPADPPLWNLISVAATTNQDGRASFSNYGAISVDIGAPGLDIASTYWDPATAYDDYWFNSGTSMAAPHVAGVVARLQALWPFLPAGNLVCPRSWADAPHGVVDRLLDTARPISSMTGITTTGGILNANNAVSGICFDGGNPPPAPLNPMPPTLFGAEDGGNGTVEISWSEDDTNAEYYLLERHEKKGKNRWINPNVVTVDNDEHSPYVDLSAAVGKTYRYRAASVNGLGSSAMTAWSANTSVTDGSGGEPDPGDGGGPKCHPKRGC